MSPKMQMQLKIPRFIFHSSQICICKSRDALFARFRFQSGRSNWRVRDSGQLSCGLSTFTVPVFQKFAMKLLQRSSPSTETNTEQSRRHVVWTECESSVGIQRDEKSFVLLSFHLFIVSPLQSTKDRFWASSRGEITNKTAELVLNVRGPT